MMAGMMTKGVVPGILGPHGVQHSLSRCQARVVGQSDWNHAGVIAELTPNLLRYIYEVLRTGHYSSICHAEPKVIEGDTFWNLFLTKMHSCAGLVLQCVLARQ